MNSITSLWHTLVTFYEARHEPERLKSLMHLLWGAALFCFLGGVAIAITFGIWEYYKVVELLSAGSDSQSARKSTLLSKKDLTDLLASYNARVQAFEQAKQSRATIPDPSR